MLMCVCVRVCVWGGGLSYIRVRPKIFFWKVVRTRIRQ